LRRRSGHAGAASHLGVLCGELLPPLVDRLPPDAVFLRDLWDGLRVCFAMARHHLLFRESCLLMAPSAVRRRHSLKVRWSEDRRTGQPPRVCNAIRTEHSSGPTGDTDCFVSIIACSVAGLASLGRDEECDVTHGVYTLNDIRRTPPVRHKREDLATCPSKIKLGESRRGTRVLTMPGRGRCLLGA
jgi:hypothetical protein